MSLSRTVATSALALAASATFATTAGAGVRWTPATATVLPTECVLTAQPWNTTSYELVAIHADGSHEQLLEQDGSHLDPTSWTYPNGEIVEVWWAAKHQPATTADDFYDVLPIDAACKFTAVYGAMPGKQDSVVIRGQFTPAPTTSTTAEVTTTTGAPVPTSTTEQVDQTTPPTVTVDATTPLPAVPWTPETLAPQPPVTVGEATPELPFTGAHTGFLVWLGGSTLLAGIGALFSARKASKR